MVPRAGEYYGTDFLGELRVTQGDPLSPTVSNVVVDAVVRHWLAVRVEGAEDRGECREEGRHQAALFYAENGMVALLDPRWIQCKFYTLVGLFDRVGLRKNVGKTVFMVYRPCHAAGNQSEAAYGRRITVEEPKYREQ